MTAILQERETWQEIERLQRLASTLRIQRDRLIEEIDKQFVELNDVAPGAAGMLKIVADAMRDDL